MLSRKRKLTGQVLTDTVRPHKYIVHTCICKQFFYHKSLKIWCLRTLRQWNTKKWILPMQSFLCQGRKVSFAQYASAFTPYDIWINFLVVQCVSTLIPDVLHSFSHILETGEWFQLTSVIRYIRHDKSEKRTTQKLNLNFMQDFLWKLSNQGERHLHQHSMNLWILIETIDVS